MDLVKVATWIQEGYKEAYAVGENNRVIVEGWVWGYVMRKGRGQLNPKIVEELVRYEDSVPDKNGMKLC